MVEKKGFETWITDTRLLKALYETEIFEPTPVQRALIPVLLRGDNAVVSAETGSGKTLAYALPALQRFAAKDETTHHYPKIFVLSPTKELAQQLYGVLKPLAKAVGLRSVLLQGGGMRAQERNRLRKGTDVIVATPQRAYEYMTERTLDIKAVRYFVIDEADMLLDMGFVTIVEAFLEKMSPKVQKTMVSATITRRVIKLAQNYFGTFKRIELTPPSKIASTIRQKLYPCVKSKKPLLLKRLIDENGWERILLFVRKKETADEVFEALRAMKLQCDVLHGERSHIDRQKVLRRFKEHKLDILIATDIVARGLDIEGLEAVVNYDIPHVKHDFVHRVGRTGRAGKEGTAVTLVSVEEIEQLNDLAELLGEKIEEVILPEFAPKIVKARGWLVMPPRRKRRMPVAKRDEKKVRDPKNPRGKKRKTTKRDRRR
jgi:ATP-dependent RNA helicase RhlE